MVNQVTTEEKQTLKKNNTSFKGDVFRLVGGTVIAQIIGVITVPIISRFFGPEAYGTAALFTSITGVIAVVCCWRYELAIVIPEKDEEAASVFFVSLFATLITTILTVIITAFYVEPLFKLLKSENLLPYKWFIPVFVLLHGIYTTFNYWNSRTKRFSRVALAGVLNSTLTRVINIISGGAMISAYTVGQAVATSTIGLQILKQDSSFLKSNFKFSEQFKVLDKYKKFPLLGIWCGFLNTLSSDLPPLLLTYFFNSIIVG
ncbi:MAG: oligosaccharide flippase family protein, partial [Candidatus Riflebacteria bacterium]|nr:oligosaccharide flippase family protein [Candidatus Riflebacteria bacterium]